MCRNTAGRCGSLYENVNECRGTHVIDTRDTSFRYLTLLQLIPRHPHRIATTTLLEKLNERGYRVDMRSLQRDLRDKLALHFPLICDDSERPYRWYFDRDYHCNLPALDTASALTLVLTEEYLKGLLPPAVAGRLDPQFRAARQWLNNLEGNGIGQWARRVRAIPNGKALLPAPLDDAIWHVVTQALMQGEALEVRYLSRSRGDEKAMTLHPQGLVSRHSVTYLLAMANDYEDIRHFALHRIRSATLAETPLRQVAAFDLDDYIKTGAFGYRQSPGDITLQARVSPQVAWLLAETPLAREQRLTPEAEGDWQRLEARVPDDQQTLWWLMGLGASVEVLAPEHWRDEIYRNAYEVIQRMDAAHAEAPR